MVEVEQLKITSNSETFTNSTYNGISVLIRDKDNFINATKMCNQFNRKFKKIFENHARKQSLEEFKIEFSLDRNGTIEIIYELKGGYAINVRGTYVDPKLINYIAFWASPKYAVRVGRIMDTINGLVHVELHKNNLPDTPTNAEPILDKIEKSLKQKLLDEMRTIEDIDSYKYRDSQANYNALDENDNFNINLYNKSLEDSSNKMFQYRK
jgi:hypothetical protein